MTDKETLMAMFDRAKVVYSNTPPDTKVPDEGILVVQEDKRYAEASSPNSGYSGFFTVFVFNTEGALISMGAWE